MDLKTIIAGLPQLNATGARLTTGAMPQPAPQTGAVLTIDIIASLLNGLFDKAAAGLVQQEKLLQSLPPAVRDAARQILVQTLPDKTLLGDGMAALLQSRRNSVDELLQLANQLQAAASRPTQEQPAAASKPAAGQPVQTPDQAQADATAQPRSLARGSQPETPVPLTSPRSAVTATPLPAARTEALSTPQPQPQSQSQPVALQLPQLAAAAKQLGLPGVARLWQVADNAEALETIAAAPGTRPDTAGTQVEAPETAGTRPAAADPALLQLKNELQVALKQFRQQSAVLLAQLPENEADPAVLQQLRGQILSAMPELLRQAAQLLVPAGNDRQVPSQPAQSQASLAAEQRPAGRTETQPSDPLAELSRPQSAGSRPMAAPELPQRPPDRELTALIAKAAPEQLEHSAATVRQLAEAVSRAFQTTSDEQGKAALFSLQLPFNADPARLQPLHIHIYHEKEREKDGGWERDTWIRVTVQPEHTGQVDTVFHFYGENILDIKVVFANKEASLLFTESVPAIRDACGKFPFLLGDISVI